VNLPECAMQDSPAGFSQLTSRKPMYLGFHNVATLSFVGSETRVDETATPVAKLIQTACAAGVFGYHLQHEISVRKLQRRGLAKLPLIDGAENNHSEIQRD